MEKAPNMGRIREAAAATKDGLPKKAYAYTPEADPASWKLPIYTAVGEVDTDRLPGAAAALSAGGFRGQKADIPAADLPMVKAKLRAAYRKWKGSGAEYPDSISEAFYDGTCYGCNHSTACDCTTCPCAAHVPEALGDVANALDALEDLYALLAAETGPDEPPEQAKYIQAAIDAVLKFIPSEGAEIPAQAAAMTESAVLTFISEVGKRNAAKDAKLIQTIHDATHDLGAGHTEGKAYGGMAMAEAEVITTGPSTMVSFAEASGEGPAFMLLSEAAATFDDATRTVTITPIKPGFGNKRDKMYYPAKTLREATGNGLFDGLKMFRNHPRKSDEKDLPERDVKDWFATSRHAEWDEARQEPRVPVVVHDESDYQRWKDAPEQIAFSIRGGGYAKPGSVGGEEANVVESLAKVRSIDWVTEAGAGGAIAFAESAAEEFDMDIKTLSTEQLREELRLREAEGEAAVADAPEAEAPEAPVAAAEAPDAPPAAEAAPEATPEVPAAPAESPVAETAPEGYVTRAEFEALQRMLGANEVKEAAQKALRDELGKSILPGSAKDIVAAEFAEAAWGNGFGYTDEPAYRKAVQGELLQAQRLLASVGKAPSPVKGLGGADAEPTDVAESVADRIAKKWGNDTMPKPPVTVIHAGDIGGVDAAAMADADIPISEGASPVADRLATKFGF